MADAGLSTLGIKVYQAETTGTEKVTDAASYSQLTRINSIGEITVTPETIDASAIEDWESRFIEGKSTVTDSLPVAFNVTNDTIAEWKEIAGKQICIMVDIPGLTDAFFVVVEVPRKLPMPALDQNSLLVMTVNCTVNNFIGLDEKVVIGA